MSHDAILSLSCADRPGIVAAVSAGLFEAGCNITEAHQYNDPDTGWCFAAYATAHRGDMAAADRPLASRRVSRHERRNAVARIHPDLKDAVTKMTAKLTASASPQK